MFRPYLVIIRPYYKNRFFEPVLIVRSVDGPIGPKYVALYVLSMAMTDMLDEYILCLNMEHIGTNKVKS
jgi:hypothetical protein